MMAAVPLPWLEAVEQQGPGNPVLFVGFDARGPEEMSRSHLAGKTQMLFCLMVMLGQRAGGRTRPDLAGPVR
jgi:hypothetical protein